MKVRLLSSLKTKLNGSNAEYTLHGGFFSLAIRLSVTGSLPLQVGQYLSSAPSAYNNTAPVM